MKLKVIVACSVKLHAFSLVEQLERHGLLVKFYTSYTSSNNWLLRKFVSRLDKEDIPIKKFETNFILAVLIKLWHAKVYYWNNLFDLWVSRKLKGDNTYVFIGWSGMSLRSIKRAKELGMITILERGSSHIMYQDQILREEYKKFGIDFFINPKVIDKELKEYTLVDYISIPSSFAKSTFLAAGIPNEKIFQNPYGASNIFKDTIDSKNKLFTILYVGGLTIRKGILYLMQAIEMLEMPIDRYQVWFIGHISNDVEPIIDQYRKKNFKFWGHINHYELPGYISQCHVAVQPSVEDGFGMVINQTLSCGVPTIATMNTGGPDIIKEGINGFLVPIRNPYEIAKSIRHLYDQPSIQKSMSYEAGKICSDDFSWDAYGNRYCYFINHIIGAE